MLGTDETVTAALGGLPGEKEHCSNLIASAIHAAIGQYLSTINGKASPISFGIPTGEEQDKTE